MNSKINNIEESVQSRFSHALQEDIPERDMQRFCQSFEKAWEQRKRWHRVLGKPIFLILFSSAALLAFGSGITFIQPNEPTASQYEAPGLMEGQRIVEQPELLSLFPSLEQPTLIATRADNNQEKETYLLHGYVENDAQIIWEQ
jgi:hypothetical protein